MKDDKIVTLRQPGEFADPLTEVLRNGARQLLTQAVEAELAECLAAHAHLTTETAFNALCGTAICRNGASRPASVR